MKLDLEVRRIEDIKLDLEVRRIKDIKLDLEVRRIKDIKLDLEVRRVKEIKHEARFGPKLFYFFTSTSLVEILHASVVDNSGVNRNNELSPWLTRLSTVSTNISISYSHHRETQETGGGRGL